MVSRRGALPVAACRACAVPLRSCPGALQLRRARGDTAPVAMVVPVCPCSLLIVCLQSARMVPQRQTRCWWPRQQTRRATRVAEML